MLNSLLVTLVVVFHCLFLVDSSLSSSLTKCSTPNLLISPNSTKSDVVEITLSDIPYPNPLITNLEIYLNISNSNISSLEIKLIQTSLNDSGIELNSLFLTSYPNTSSNVLNIIFSDSGDSIITNSSDLSCEVCKYKSDMEIINDIFNNTNPLSNFNISIKYPFKNNNGKLKNWCVIMDYRHETNDPTKSPTDFTNYPSMSPTIRPTPVPTFCPTCRNDYEAMFNTIEPESSQAFTVVQENNPMITGNLFITMYTRPCKSPRVTVQLAPTDYDSDTEYLTIYVDGEYVGICDPGVSESCIPTYDCFIQRLVNRNIGIGQVLHVQFVPYSGNSINTGQGCTSYSFWGTVTVYCDTQTPTMDPTTHPSVSPSKYPSVSPTVSSISPSKAPTFSPTFSPTNSPTIPTTDPTTAPTFSPTFPSFSPTTAPTNAPTIMPSHAPTRTPTKSGGIYDGYFTIQLFFDALSPRAFNTLNNRSQATIDDLDEIIEMVYFDHVSSVAAYKDFDVVIIVINDITLIEAGTSYENENSGGIVRRRARNLLQSSGSLQYELWTSEKPSETFDRLHSKKDNSFETTLAVSLLQYLYNTDNLTLIEDVIDNFDFDVVNDFTKVNKLSLIERIYGNQLLLANIILIVVTIIIGIWAYLHMMFGCAFPGKKSDRVNNWALLLYSLQMLDLLSDFLFVRDVYFKWNNNKRQMEYVLLFGFSLLFIILPWILNMTHILFNTKGIKKHFIENDNGIIWFREYNKFLALLVAVAGGLYPALMLVNSQCFGLEMLAMGLSMSELDKFLKLKIWLNVLMENVPQLGFQVLFIMLNPKRNGSIGTFMAMGTSLLSIISTILQYRLSKTTEHKKRYRIEITTKHYLYDQRRAGWFKKCICCCCYCCFKGSFGSSDYANMQSRCLMQTLFHDNLARRGIPDIKQVEVVSISVEKEKTVIILDYFGVENYLRKLKESENLSKIKQSIEETFHLKHMFNYPVSIIESRLQWNKTKYTFVQNMLDRYNLKLETCKPIDVMHETIKIKEKKFHITIQYKTREQEKQEKLQARYARYGYPSHNTNSPQYYSDNDDNRRLSNASNNSNKKFFGLNKRKNKKKKNKNKNKNTNELSNNLELEIGMNSVRSNSGIRESKSGDEFDAIELQELPQDEYDDVYWEEEF